MEREQAATHDTAPLAGIRCYLGFSVPQGPPHSWPSSSDPHFQQKETLLLLSLKPELLPWQAQLLGKVLEHRIIRLV